MSQSAYWTRFAVAALATWRVSHLLAKEDGPGDIMVHARARLGSGFAGQLMDCFQCLSLWVAAPAAMYVSRRPPEALAAWLALSGAACLLERAGEPTVAIEPLSQQLGREGPHGMLRTGTQGSR